MVPKDRVRALFMALAFLLLLIIAVGSGAAWLGTTSVILVWSALLVGCIVIIVKSIRRGQAGIYGQLGALPHSWRRWILDEHERQRPDQRADPDDQHGS